MKTERLVFSPERFVFSTNRPFLFKTGNHELRGDSLEVDYSLERIDASNSGNERQS